MAAKGGRIDFMFLAPLPPGRWIRYCHLPITNSVNKVCAYIIDLLLAGLLSVCCDVLQTTKCASASGNKETSIELLSRVSHAEKENSVKEIDMRSQSRAQTFLGPTERNYCNCQPNNFKSITKLLNLQSNSRPCCRSELCSNKNAFQPKIYNLRNTLIKETFKIGRNCHLKLI